MASRVRQKSSRGIIDDISLATAIGAHLKGLIPKPRCGNFFLDIIFLLFIAALQFGILPSFFGRYTVIDLFIPWLIVCVVSLSPGKALVMILLGSLIIETHSASPAGLYLCTFVIIYTLIYLCHHLLSWKYMTTWLVCIGLAEILTISFEISILSVNAGTTWISPIFILAQMARIFIACALGIWLSQYVTIETIQTKEL